MIYIKENKNFNNKTMVKNEKKKVNLALAIIWIYPNVIMCFKCITPARSKIINFEKFKYSFTQDLAFWVPCITF